MLYANTDVRLTIGNSVSQMNMASGRFLASPSWGRRGGELGALPCQDRWCARAVASPKFLCLTLLSPARKRRPSVARRLSSYSARR